MTLRPEQVRDAIRDSGAKQKWHADGRSLYLVTKGGRGFWVLHFRDPREADKPVRNTGLGSADTVTAAAARKARDAFMVALAEGRPVAIATRKAKGELFSTAAATYLSNHADEWDDRTRKADTALVANKVPADFQGKAVTEITAEDVAETLRPIWDGPGNNRGSRLRRLMFGVFGAKNVNPNPARWDDGPLPGLLSRKRPAVVNRPSMPYAEVRAFLKTKTDSVEDRAGRFIILSAVRREEALEAKWSEFDFANRVWNIPAARMKMKRSHRVPLTGCTASLPGLVIPSFVARVSLIC
jgi:integrase